MYICLCKAVRESDIYDAVELGARNMRELTAATGCSTNCGKCARAAMELLDEALRAKKVFLRVVSSSQVA